MAADSIRVDVSRYATGSGPAAQVDFILIPPTGPSNARCSLTQLGLAPGNTDTSRELLAFLEGRQKSYCADSELYIFFSRDGGNVHFNVGSGLSVDNGRVRGYTSVWIPEEACIAAFAGAARELRALGLEP